MKSQDTPFVGGPLDGRVLPVLLGLTGHPPKTYRVPVPDADGGPPTVLVYRRVPAGPPGRFGLHPGWKYAYDPEGDLGGRQQRWPWPKPRTKARGTAHGDGPDATAG
ncbi:hypothetical protein ACFZAR_10060 [Streptomyces sp. NPDC008222]|uniref:hypothetical protein n=1 Tax=Streptomyces sp. NPDC008222 TaxID=3364820 RepID=UPI0036E56720